MKSFRIILILVIAFLFTVHLNAQEFKNYKYPTHKLLQSADSLICIKDTVKSITLLEEFIAKTDRKQISYDYKNECTPITNRISPSSIYADICLEISELCLETNNPTKSIAYIYKAKIDHMPRFGGCLNAMLMYKTKISIYQSQYYIETDQNNNAISTLLEYFIYEEGYSVLATKKLKELLKEEYSKWELNEIVLSAIKDIDLDENKKPQIKLFGQTITLWQTSSIIEAKEYCMNNKNLNTILE